MPGRRSIDLFGDLKTLVEPFPGLGVLSDVPQGNEELQDGLDLNGRKLTLFPHLEGLVAVGDSLLDLAADSGRNGRLNVGLGCLLPGAVFFRLHRPGFRRAEGAPCITFPDRLFSRGFCVGPWPLALGRLSDGIEGEKK